ncbi:methyltransferase domain-containing protein [Actinospica sp. MGRD01-02]|uniref:Methyltransferase domain-containing protein n=1 Tax=Actinospica acidithermotolerans TaxID=2828514 RepID=A0A941EAA1_9ACTN|nr:methyltransferase domain-containing protein [Actinospica acidithermotolerans]MBR7827851.1 methyltransferase domain-containing protein [Actinospica acidithermotolerans]
MTDNGTASSAPTPYLDAVAATDIARSYKHDLLTALAIEPGHHVLDVGCGPGTDLIALASATGPGGAVFGIDQDPHMVATARTRTADHPGVQVRQADAHRLPFADHSIDRARADRVLMHVADPAAVLTEIRRVLRPGGLLTLAEPDWDALAIDHPDLAISRAFTRYIAERVNRNQAIGRQLPRLATQAGYTLHAVRNTAAVFTDFATAETILGLRRNTRRAVTAGYLTADDARTWLTHLTTGTFFATSSFITVLAQSGAWSCRERSS